MIMKPNVRISNVPMCECTDDVELYINVLFYCLPLKICNLTFKIMFFIRTFKMRTYAHYTIVSSVFYDLPHSITPYAYEYG